MSHDATNWAVKQRGLKPAAKVVLWQLCDRYHPDHGCFPSQSTLSADCEMSERSIRDQIQALEEHGLIIKIRRSGKKGEYKSNGYKFAFEDDFTSGETPPAANSASGKNTSKPAANSRHIQRQNLPPNLVIEPVIEPVRAPKGTLARFDEIWSIFPKRFGSNEGQALKAFRELDKLDQEKCIDHAARYRQHLTKVAAQMGEKFEDRCKRAPYLSNWIKNGDWMAAKDLPADKSRSPEVQALIKSTTTINRDRDMDLFKACAELHAKPVPEAMQAYAFPKHIVEQARGQVHG